MKNKFMILISVALIMAFFALPVFAQPVVVTFWEGMGAKLGTTLQTITDLFNKQNPDIQVKLVYLGSDDDVDSKLLTALTANNLPTMSQLEGPWGSVLVSKGVVAPLYEFPGFTQLASSIYAPLLVSGTFNGKVYTLPFNRDVFDLFVRPQIFEQAGLSYPKTMNEMAQDAKLLTVVQNGKTVRYGLGFRTTYRQFTAVAYQFGGNYVSPDGKITINSPQNVAALTYLVNLVKEGYAYGKFDYFDNELTTSSVAMLLGGSAELTYDLSDIAGQSDGLVMVPIPSDVTFRPMLYGNNIAIFNTATPEQQQAAWKYLQFLLSPAIQLYWAVQTGYIPAAKQVADLSQWQNFVSQNTNGINTIMIGLDQSADYAPNLPWWTTASDAIQTAFQNAVNFKMTPQEALDWAQQQAEQAYASYNAK
ncbi:MAG: ABC transporter substrate-binding protein [Athalassotoga sp.]|uniref:ABC transporter substrate-binding protein n=1 Tax=Athalassotoga sp. TaxID=2022597 RepID=UPI003D088247